MYGEDGRRTEERKRRARRRLVDLDRAGHHGECMLEMPKGGLWLSVGALLDKEWALP